VEKGKISTALVNPTEDHDKRRVTGLLLREVASAITVTVETLQTSDLPDGDVTVGVEYSDVNYKDGMAITGISHRRIVLFLHSRHRFRRCC